MIQYINKNGKSHVRATGNMTQLCAETVYLIHRLWAALGDRGEDFKQTITACITDPASPVFRKGNDQATPTEKTPDPEDTAWNEEWSLYEEAVEHFGETAQIMQAIEEMAELTQALNKHLRYNQFGQGNIIDALKKIQEERADVEIMLNQLHVIFGDTSKTECEKLEHLRNLLHPNKSWEV